MVAQQAQQQQERPGGRESHPEKSKEKKSGRELLSSADDVGPEYIQAIGGPGSAPIAQTG